MRVGASTRVLLTAPLLGLLVGCERAECSKIETVFENRPDFVALAFDGREPSALLGRYHAAEGWALGGDGAFQRQMFANGRDAFPEGTWLRFQHLGFRSGEGWSVITWDAVVHIQPANVPALVVRLRLAGQPDEAFTVERAWLIDGTVFLLGNALGGVHLARLSDDRVVPLGAALNIVPGSGWEGLRFFGGWDGEAQRLLVETRDELVALSLEGQILERRPRATGGAYALHWVRLEDGRWAGLHGDLWHFFTPGEANRAIGETIGRVGVTTTTTQALDPSGVLWVVSHDDTGDLIVRQRPQGGALGPEVRTHHLVRTCDIALTIDR